MMFSTLLLGVALVAGESRVNLPAAEVAWEAPATFVVGAKYDVKSRSAPAMPPRKSNPGSSVPRPSRSTARRSASAARG